MPSISGFLHWNYYFFYHYFFRDCSLLPSILGYLHNCVYHTFFFNFNIFPVKSNYFISKSGAAYFIHFSKNRVFTPLFKTICISPKRCLGWPTFSILSFHMYLYNNYVLGIQNIICRPSCFLPTLLANVSQRGWQGL